MEHRAMLVEAAAASERPLTIGHRTSRVLCRRYYPASVVLRPSDAMAMTNSCKHRPTATWLRGPSWRHGLRDGLYRAYQHFNSSIYRATPRVRHRAAIARLHTSSSSSSSRRRSSERSVSARKNKNTTTKKPVPHLREVCMTALNVDE